MDKPENEQDYIRFMAEDIEVYLSKEIWDGLDPQATELRFAIAGRLRNSSPLQGEAGRGWIFRGRAHPPLAPPSEGGEMPCPLNVTMH